MREIKFRAWNPVDNNWWIWQDFVMNPSPPYDIANFVSKVEGYDNLSLIFEQFTGLKDKNGKEIYEGDIVEYEIVVEEKRGKYSERLEVYWEGENGYGWSPFVERDQDGNNWRDTPDKCIVIGNIHQNPELLKGIE